MITRTKGVGFYGKVRIPTIGHAAVVNTAKDIAAKSGAKLHVALSGADHPRSAVTGRATAAVSERGLSWAGLFSVFRRGHRPATLLAVVVSTADAR